MCSRCYSPLVSAAPPSAGRGCTSFPACNCTTCKQNAAELRQGASLNLKQAAGAPTQGHDPQTTPPVAALNTPDPFGCGQSRVFNEDLCWGRVGRRLRRAHKEASKKELWSHAGDKINFYPRRLKMMSFPRSIPQSPAMGSVAVGKTAFQARQGGECLLEMRRSRISVCMTFMSVILIRRHTHFSQPYRKTQMLY